MTHGKIEPINTRQHQWTVGYYSGVVFCAVCSRPESEVKDKPCHVPTSAVAKEVLHEKQ